MFVKVRETVQAREYNFYGPADRAEERRSFREATSSSAEGFLVLELAFRPPLEKFV